MVTHMHANEELLRIYEGRYKWLTDSAAAWDMLGFHSNARYFREEAKCCLFDIHMIKEELGLVAKREGTTIAR